MILNEICTVVSNTALTNTLFSMEIKTDKMAKDALCGQFVHIKCGDAVLLRRPISICDAYGDTLRIVFEVKGTGTDFLAKCKTGDKLDILGPIGKGFNIEKSGDSPVFIGGGIGVPPLLLSCKKAKQAGKTVTAILGFRNHDAVILEEEFTKVCDKVIITTDDGSYGMHGFVSDALTQNIEKFTAIHSCGPHAMLKALKNASGGLYCEVSMEERMGCGIGACLVCACKVKSNDKDFDLKHVCKDGPVFDASEVIL